MWKPDKSKYKDAKGRYIVQGLFLEDSYNTDLAVFTFDGEDKVYKGKTYKSLKKLYLDRADPVEYLFATENLYDWDHWQRLCKNKVLKRHIDKWREELHLYLMSEGVSSLIDLSIDKQHVQASKYLADRGWDVSKVGRPTKEQVEGEIKKKAEAETEYDNDFEVIRLINKE